MKFRIVILLLITFLSTYSYARESFNEHVLARTYPPSAVEETPWFTGPILTPSAHVVPCGHQNYEPYIYWTQINGVYDSNWHPHSSPLFTNVLLQGTIQIGIFKDFEFDLAPQEVYNRTQGQHMWRVSDLPLALGYQILEDTIDKQEQWWPAIKLRLGLNVPLGKYDHLNPTRLGTDAGGIGTWYPGVGIVFSKLFHIKDIHFLSTRLFLTYNVGTAVNVKDLSIYGGADAMPGVPGTKGKVYPGNIFLLLNGYELSLTQNWALALDFEYQHMNRARFSGSSPAGTRPGLPSQEVFAFAPGLEYNWNANVGIIAGPWFTFAGRNANRFISYVAALNIYV